MSTVDIVSQVGGEPANFLDIGGGANADVMANALEVINNDAEVRSIFINIFGGITKGEEVANGIVQALGRVDIRSPIVIRLDGTNADEGRAILAEHESDRLVSQPTMIDAARKAVAMAGDVVSIFVDETTKVVYQGLTGSQGRFYGLRNREYGTQVVAGTNPKKAGTDVDGIPIFATVKEAVAETGANASCVFIPAPGVADAVLEAAEGGIEFVVVITEGVPAHDEACFYNRLKRDYPGTRLLGPNCPGIISPGKCNIGITAGEIAMGGGPVGIVSRSGTLTYQALHEMTQRGIGQTTCVGIGGDPVPGTSFIDCPRGFRGRPRDRRRDHDRRDRRLGRGGSGRVHQPADEEAGRRLRRRVTAPPGKKMGHAGAIISGSKGTAAAKIEALEDAGCLIAPEPDRDRRRHGRGRRHAVGDPARPSIEDGAGIHLLWTMPRRVPP